MSDFSLSSPVFDDGERIPEKHGHDAADISPPLSVAGVPDGTASLALVMDDPDAVEPAGKVWDHWLVWNVPPDGEHTYRFRAFALDTTLDLPVGATKDVLEVAMSGDVLAEAKLKGTYAP